MTTPTIVVNKPGTVTHSVPTAVHSNAGRPLTPKISTTSFPSKGHEQSCYLCDEQNPGDFSPTTKFLETCLLCCRPFCPVHKAVQFEKVCNINHSQYYHERLEKARDEIAQKSPDGVGRRPDAEEVLNEGGVYPSLGEREKVIFRTSPVSPEKMKEIAHFRSLDAELSGTKGKGASILIEEREAYAADIAV
ncbi:hypothetical protein LTS08_000745 [Lithohypha guttulata]|uniref:uncharacterized protein n=1 Tax=Lithohypha guttulata TaxID=1690604 RepID=UPI002DE0591A|nr:hypothetical protein LTR51_006644 [Lithohypha guttulata]KAK5106624.1 hypothetical protein LTS08_000745 [Lithohypha guttulata]